MPSPPFPAHDDAVLRVIVGNALAAVESGETDVRGAILHAAVHAWYEGHVQGEDSCPGCDFRGSCPRAVDAFTSSVLGPAGVQDCQLVLLQAAQNHCVICYLVEQEQFPRTAVRTQADHRQWP